MANLNPQDDQTSEDKETKPILQPDQNAVQSTNNSGLPPLPQENDNQSVGDVEITEGTTTSSIPVSLPPIQAGSIEEINPTIKPSVTTQDVTVPSNWIPVIDGKFTCSECENTSVPETNTVEGTVEADVEKVKSDLIAFPSKIIYGICPVCGMEFVFRQKNDALYMEPSELEK
jgi:hypothetical protein